MGEQAAADVRAGDVRAAPRDVLATALTFDDLYTSVYDDVVRLAFLLVDSNAVAEELVQDAFVRVHAKWRTIEHPRAYCAARW